MIIQTAGEIRTDRPDLSDSSPAEGQDRVKTSFHVSAEHLNKVSVKKVVITVIHSMLDTHAFKCYEIHSWSPALFLYPSLLNTDEEKGKISKKFKLKL